MHASAVPGPVMFPEVSTPIAHLHKEHGTAHSRKRMTRHEVFQ